MVRSFFTREKFFVNRTNWRAELSDNNLSRIQRYINTRLSFEQWQFRPDNVSVRELACNASAMSAITQRSRFDRDMDCSELVYASKYYCRSSLIFHSEARTGTHKLPPSVGGVSIKKERVCERRVTSYSLIPIGVPLEICMYRIADSKLPRSIATYTGDCKLGLTPISKNRTSGKPGFAFYIWSSSIPGSWLRSILGSRLPLQGGGSAAIIRGKVSWRRWRFLREWMLEINGNLDRRGPTSLMLVSKDSRSLVVALPRSRMALFIQRLRGLCGNTSIKRDSRRI